MRTPGRMPETRVRRTRDARIAWQLSRFIDGLISPKIANLTNVGGGCHGNFPKVLGTCCPEKAWMVCILGVYICLGALGQVSYSNAKL